ncbi:hypothetical protein [Laceyella sediminis]|uniref:hypothetical protein n=1 Tax=Laceyella sediminis TaxID=573074 RepID=UPI0011B29509|nr:hypothetical protein [Laceyella sediminis]
MSSLIVKHEEATFHCIASHLMSLPLCSIDGAYNVGFYHAKRAVELSPEDASFKEHLLFYHAIPDKLLSDEEAEKIAKSILEMEPDNQTAKKHLRLIRRD